jgi:putative nucleotidyltransferase with HDIG domain
MPSYDDALRLFHEWTHADSLRRHAYAVEAGLGYYARHFGEDETLWRMTGLLHDMDYERYPSPENHPYIGVQVLRERGFPEEMAEAILGHAPYTGTPRSSLLARSLFAVDELAGFIVAVALVRPTRLDGLQPKSVRNKLKDRAFAAAVNRDDIRLGTEELGVDLNEHIVRLIEALRLDARRLGLEPTNLDEHGAHAG